MSSQETDKSVKIEDVLSSLKSLYLTNIKAQTEIERNQVVREVRRADLYYRGIQYLATINLGDGRTGLVNASQVYDFLRSETAGADAGAEITDYNLNFYKGDVDKFVAVAMKQTIQHKAKPIADTYKDRAENKLRVADEVSDYLDTLWDLPAQREKVLYGLALYGPTFLYTPFISDARLGKTVTTVYSHRVVDRPAQWACVECGEQFEQGQEEEGPQGELLCPHCKAPLVEEALTPGTQEIELEEEQVETVNGTTQIHVTNYLTTWIPKGCTGPEDAPWWLYEYEAPMGHINRLMAQAQQKMVKSAPSMDLAAWARNRVMTPANGVPRMMANVVRVTRVWFTPGMYWELAQSQERVRDWLEEKHPRGCMVLFLNDEPVLIDDEAITDCWVVVSPQMKDYLLNQQAVFHPYLEGVEITNAIVNMVEGIIATSAPVTAYRSDLIDPNVVNSLMRSYRSMIPVKSDPRGALYDLPISQPSGVAQAFIQFVIGLVREIVGISPTMWGAGNFNTAREATLAAEQSLQVFHPIFMKVAKGFAQAKHNAALLLAEYSGGVLPLKDGRTQPLLVEEVDVLLEGGWKYDFDPTLAVSSAARRDTLRELTNNPAAMEMTGLNHPFNIRNAQEILGLNGMYVPGEDELKFVQEQIDRVLNGEAVPLPPTNIINPKFAVDVVKATLLSDRGRQILATDPQAWQMGLEWMEGLLGMMGQEGGPPPPPPEGEGGMPPPLPPPQDGPPMLPPPSGPEGMEGPPIPPQGELDSAPLP